MHAIMFYLISYSLRLNCPMVMKHLGLYIYSVLQSVVMKDFGLVFWDDAKHTQIMLREARKYRLFVQLFFMHAIMFYLISYSITQACPMVMKDLGLYIYSVLG